MFQSLKEDFRSVRWLASMQEKILKHCKGCKQQTPPYPEVTADGQVIQIGQVTWDKSSAGINFGFIVWEQSPSKKQAPADKYSVASSQQGVYQS